MIRPMTFQPGAFLRSCDLCGFRFRSTELFKGEDGFWRCRRTCLEVPAITRDKISAESQKRREAPPPPHGKPFETLPAFEAESRLFNFLTEIPIRDNNWPGIFRTGVPPSTSVLANDGGAGPLFSANYSALATGETMRYLCALIAEAKRPLRWVAPARAKVIQLADWLISIQHGFGIGPTTTTQANQAYWGVYRDNSTAIMFTQNQAAAGLGMLLAYRLTGTSTYLTSAYAAASALRNVQAIGSHESAGFTSSDPAGTVRLYTGGILSSVSNVTSTWNGSQQFEPESLLVTEFWKELFTTMGDVAIGATGTASGIFTGAPSQVLSISIAQSRVFWLTGTFDDALGVVITGLSATTPHQRFAAFPLWTGSWEYLDGDTAIGTTISGTVFACALRSLFAYEGYSAQVSSVWTWLMGFASNPAFVSPAGTLPIDFSCVTTSLAANPPPPPPRSGNVVAPFYDPTLALTTELLVRTPGPLTPTAQNATALYDWTTSGMMAAIQSSQNGGKYRKAKTAVTTDRFRLPVNFTFGQPPVVDFAYLRGTTGLAFQLNHSESGSNKLWSSTAASRIGNMFRYQPQGWTGTQSPSQQPGVRV